MAEYQNHDALSYTDGWNAAVEAAIKMVRERREAEVANRPPQNIHRAGLLNTWNQAERRLNELKK